METALEHTLTNSRKNGMVAYIHTHPEDFEELIELALSDKQPYAWRAGWHPLCVTMPFGSLSGSPKDTPNSGKS